MKMTMEYHPNENVATIHVNEQITDVFTTEDFDSAFNKSDNKLIKSVKAHVKGVTYLSLRRYSVSFGKGAAFLWGEVLPGVKKEINQYLNTKETK